uniref:Uncharacterized protein n=1 Tax=Meloidogyne hapla TaxID=6305 RepID=A0A1I8BTV7_MELHA
MMENKAIMLRQSPNQHPISYPLQPQPSLNRMDSIFVEGNSEFAEHQRMLEQIEAAGPNVDPNLVADFRKRSDEMQLNHEKRKEERKNMFTFPINPINDPSGHMARQIAG